MGDYGVESRGFETMPGMNAGELEGTVACFVESCPSLPGCVGFVIGSDGRRRASAAGVADLETRRPMTEDATFRIASSTKTFTAATVLRLTEEGALDLDDAARRFLEDDRVQRLDLADVTLRHLLQHTSGLPDMDGDVFMSELFAQPHKRWTPWEKIERSLTSGPRTGPVGPPARYCDVGYVIAAMVIEAVAGVPLHQAFRQLLHFDRLRLRSLHVEELEPTPSTAGPRVRHYVADRDVSDIHPSCDLWGAGGLISDAHDLAEWWHALFAGQIFDDENTLRIMLTTVPEPTAGRDMGLGLYRRTIDGHEIWAHGGWWGTYPFHDRTTGTTGALLMNQALDHVGPRLAETVLQVLAY